MIKKVLAAFICTITAASALTSCGKEIEVETTSDNNSGNSSSSSSGSADTQSNVSIANFTAPSQGDKIIVMNIKDYGTVKIRLFPEYADKGVENFIGLAEQGYYDGLTFHRVINDFMIQGGDPLGTGTGGESLWGEKFEGGTDPHLIHAAGALAYANSGATSTNGSQFYIVTGQVYSKDELIANGYSEQAAEIYSTAGGTPWLDGSYTVFGQVIDGLDIIFKVQTVATNESDKPLTDVIMESVKVEDYDGSEPKWYITDYDGFTLSDDNSESEDSSPDTLSQSFENVPAANFTEPEIGETVINMSIRDYGDVKIKLFPEYAEKGVENFVELAKSGYYDGLTFHRVINDFMIQGGDPEGTGRGGESVWGGGFDGGTDAHLIHAAGAVAYANSGSTATDGSQFYIVTGERYTEDDLAGLESYGYFFSDSAKEIYTSIGGTPWLDGSYTVFGQVYDGLDIIFDIQTVTTDTGNDKPLEDIVIDSMTVGEYDGSQIRWYISDYDDTSSDDSETYEAADDIQTDEAEISEESAE